MADSPKFELTFLSQQLDWSVYRGQKVGDPTRLLVISLNSEGTSFHGLHRLQHEYSLRERLDASWAAKPLLFSRYDGRPALVLLDPGGSPLDQILGGMHRQDLGLGAAIRIAIGIAAALRQMHKCGITHRDIKPSNILVDERQRVWLTGFGVASLLPNERQPVAPPETIAGTFAYMAPEQTGRMNRSMDTRSDLYSMGVTMYQMFTGHMPFSATDALEWIHCHIARAPAAIVGRDNLPLPLISIILRLLAKAAEDRYQTAAGLEADLLRCSAEYESRGFIDQFILGTQDVSNNLFIPERLYGREGTIEVLTDTFERVVQSGSCEVLLISGSSGVGKSSVANELQKSITPSNAMFAAGKFDLHNQAAPYKALAQAMQNLVKPLLTQPATELERWARLLREVLGTNGQLMVDLVPELELVIGKQVDVSALSARDGPKRFHVVIQRFLSLFACESSPLVLFLDDLQWGDRATLDVIKHLFTHPDVKHFLLIGTYRKEDVGLEHPLFETIRTISKVGIKVREIALEALAPDTFGSFVADALHCDAKRAGPLAELLQQKTAGNPFFTIQFLKSLVDEQMLTFEAEDMSWHWNIDQIRAKNFSDNVVDLMAAQLRRLPPQAQATLKHMACLGNLVDIETLAIVNGMSQESTNQILWEAVRAGIVFRSDDHYRFLHDRIEEAAYSLVPQALRTETHAQIGRVLIKATPNSMRDYTFAIAKQFSLGDLQISEPVEQYEVATVFLNAGRRAKASGAYAPGSTYLATGIAILGHGTWQSHYELTFSLCIERAESELLMSNFVVVKELITEMLSHTVSNIDKAAVLRLKMMLHVVEGDLGQSVASALTCLRLFDITLPDHPSLEEVHSEYANVLSSLGGNSIESLIDLPVLVNKELQATIQVLSTFLEAAYFTDFNLFCLVLCYMVRVSVQHGMSDAGAHAFGLLGTVTGYLFKRYEDGYQFTNLAYQALQKHGFALYRTKIYFSMGQVARWTQPIATAIEFSHSAFRSASETGDFTFACYGMHELVKSMFLQNDPLHLVDEKAAVGFTFAQRAGYRDGVDLFVSQQQFIANMQGRTRHFSSFEDATFDEVSFEASLTSERMPSMVCQYWILKLKARFLSGDYTEALAAATKAEKFLWSLAAQIAALDYVYYSALTIAELYKEGTSNEQVVWRRILLSHQSQLLEWTQTYEPTFGDKYALVSAEIARLDGRESEAMRLYEKAIQFAKHNGFIQYEGTCYEVSARFYRKCGIETVAHTYLINARNCYDRWGAHGKVKQLDENHRGSNESRVTNFTPTIDKGIDQLDIETVTKASQALSSEMSIDKLISRIMRITVEHAGAERGLLILYRDSNQQIGAKAVTMASGVVVSVKEEAVKSSDLPLSALHYVARTRCHVVLDDALQSNPYSDDPYIKTSRPRSVLFLPIVKQTLLVGVLYLENSLTPGAFPSQRVTVLQLLASQAAISLENARLYSDLQQNEGKLRAAMDTIPAYVWSTMPDGTVDFFNRRMLESTGLSEAALANKGWKEIIHADDLITFAKDWQAALMSGKPLENEVRIRMIDGHYRWLLVRYVPLRDVNNVIVKWYGTGIEIEEKKRAQDQLRQTEAELAQVSLITSMGELTASLAHEVNQPIAAAVTDASTCLRWLNRAVPDLVEARAAALRSVNDARRAAAIVQRIRLLFTKGSLQYETIDLNSMILEMAAILSGELSNNSIILRLDLAEGLPTIFGDRVRLQQVMMNLIMNSIQAMESVDRPRNLAITSQEAPQNEVLVSVTDTGTGLPLAQTNQIFDAFYTTKSGGTGMGLRISRSIIESHGGRLWTAPASALGACLLFTLPRPQGVST
jgi:PAS domain S-box-containing protein